MEKNLKMVRRGRFKNIKRIELASQDKIDKYPEEVLRLLKGLGFPEALVTDLSALTDFWTFLSDDEMQKKIRVLQKKLGVEVNKKDYLIDIIKRMVAKKEGKN